MLIVNQDASATEARPVAHDAWGQRRDDHEDDGDTRCKGKGKGKEKSIAEVTNDISSSAETSLDAATVDWTKYEPPEGLTYVGDMDSEMIMQIIQQSIDRVRARIAEEEETRKAAAEADKTRHEEAPGEEDAEAASTASKGKGIGSIQDEASLPDWPLRSTSQDGSTAEDDTARTFPAELPKRSARGLLKFLRKFNTGPEENGESSAAGAARSFQDGFRTHSAKKSLVSELINRSKEPEFADVECVSCLEDFPESATVRAPCHAYCKPCFRRLIITACRNEQHWPPKCCLNTIPETTIYANVKQQQKQKQQQKKKKGQQQHHDEDVDGEDDGGDWQLLWAEYAERALEWNVPVADRVYCGQPECALYIRPDYVIRAQGVARCASGHYTCLICRNPQHPANTPCPRDEDAQRTNELAEASGWKRCQRCRALVEHSDGCQHMTCRCGAEFCYVCGAPWQTCSCTMTHLAEAKRAALARQHERRDREDAEEAEIAEALRLVRAFEAEEERRVLLRREEERRRAEERWRKRRGEIERERSAVGARFEELRALVAAVQEAQRLVVQTGHGKKERRLAVKADAIRRRLCDLHALERETGRAKVEERIKRREGKIRAEYVARAVEESQIEEQYAAKLREFWGGKGGDEGAKEVEAAMADLRVRMDGWFKEWKKSTDNDLVAYRHSLREEQGILEELMDEKERRLDTRTREVMLGVAKRKAAELRWVREVFEEHGRLLDELENIAIEELGDVGDEFPEDPLEQEAWMALKE